MTNSGSGSKTSTVQDSHSTVSSNTIRESNSLPSGKDTGTASSDGNGNNVGDGSSGTGKPINPTYNSNKDTPLILPSPMPFP